MQNNAFPENKEAQICIILHFYGKIMDFAYSAFSVRTTGKLFLEFGTKF
jgi:hypothetical protein